MDSQDEEKIATKVLLMKLVRDYDARARALENKKAAEAELDAATQRYFTTWQSLAVLGFDTSAVKINLFEQIRAFLGDDVYDDAVAAARFGDAALAVTSIEATASVPPPDPKEEMPTIRELVVRYLASAEGVGTKASDIRRQVESVLHRSIHYKTIGMTLFRLSKQGLARSEGHTWFPVQPKAETENPGVTAPGSKDGVFG